MAYESIQPSVYLAPSCKTISSGRKRLLENPFIGILNYSPYVYVEAFYSIDMESRITAHVHMYQYFGGNTRILIPDNFRTGADHSDWYTPKINKTCHEMAEHYDATVIPAHVRVSKRQTFGIRNCPGPLYMNHIRNPQ